MNREIERFNAKADRLAAALDRFPTARISEILPILWAIDSGFGHTGIDICDMMAGTGYLSGHLARRARRLVMVDGSPRMLQYAAARVRAELVVKQQDGDVAEIAALGPFDVITCLAGLHHVIDDDGGGAKQLELLKAWRSLLKPHGMIILADVPYLSPESSERHVAVPPALRAALSDDDVSPCDYSEIVRWQARVAMPSAASFFDTFVSQASVVGHRGRFVDKQFLDALPAPSCYKALATPWLFHSARDAAWYFHEKFAIGTGCGSPAELPVAELQRVLRALDDHLGMTELCGGGLAVKWSLTYIVLGGPAGNKGEVPWCQTT